jgi:hypothetical protein
MGGYHRWNAALKITAVVGFAALIGLAAACSSRAPVAHYIDAACPAAIAALPAHLPVTEEQALADEHAVDSVHTKDTMLQAMTHIVGIALSNVGLDIARGRRTSAPRATYNADVTVLRSNCRARPT